MAVVRCPNGHFYDDQKFFHCPYCGVGTEALPEGKKEEAGPEKKKRGLFGWLDSEKTVAFSQKKEEKEEAHTIALEAIEAPDEDVKTVGFYSDTKGNDYVTGWLVCTEGPEKGRDYRLHHGFNRIGRDMDMDVQVMDDPTITRKNHCSVVYDEKSGQFSLVPGSGTLTYYHTELLAGPKKLEAGDEIKMGNSVFVFIPFCVEGRVWKREEEF